MTSAENALRLQVEHLSAALADEREKVARLERERDELAARLAALREAAADAAVASWPEEHDGRGRSVGPGIVVDAHAFAELSAAIADVARAAEAYTRRVQAEAYEDDAAALEAQARDARAARPDPLWVRAERLESEAARLRARAAKLRGGR